MEQMKWNETYSTGNDEVDSQHRRLFGMINTLIMANDENMDRKTVGRMLEEMMDYVGYHFNCEESYFAGHPEADAHRLEHSHFMHQAMMFNKKFKEGDGQIGQNMLEFLIEWLNEHTLNTDIRFLRESDQQD